jgi:hypothetical protein
VKNTSKILDDNNLLCYNVYIMKKTFFKLFIFSIFIFYGSFIFADTPTFKTIDPVAVTDESAYLRGEFNSNGNNYNPNEMPVAWFQYGINKQNLDKKTIEVVKTKGYYISSQYVSGLEPDTKYWFQSVLRFSGETFYGQKKSFITKKIIQNTSNSESDTQTTQTFLSPEELLQQYQEATSGSVLGDEENCSDSNVTVFKNNEPLHTEKEKRSPFFTFWSWLFGGGDKDSSSSGNDSSSNINNEKSQQDNQNDQENHSDNVSQNNNGTHFSQSASEDDELGEVIEYNTNYKNNYKRTKIRNTKRKSINYIPLFITIFILIILIILLRMVYLFFRRRNSRLHTHSNYQNNSQKNTIKNNEYYIPIRKDLIHKKENPEDFLNRQ